MNLNDLTPKMKRLWTVSVALVIIILGFGIYGGVRYFSVPSRPVQKTRQLKRRQGEIDHTPNGGRLALISSHAHFRKNQAKAIVAMDARTGQIVYQKHPYQLRKVASLSKLMTLFLVEQKVSRTKHGWQQVVNTKKPNLRRMSYDRKNGLGGFKFKRNRRYTVRDLFKAALIQSSNNAAIALGQWVAGSNARFVKLMNQQSRAWHLGARFVSASGLENNDLKPYGLKIRGGKHAGNLVSARDVAIIARHLLVKYPRVVNVSHQRSAKVEGQPVNNLNRLLSNRRRLPVDGLKTGFTPDAGYCFVGTGQIKGHDRLITVILHDPKDVNDTHSLMKFVYRNSRLFNSHVK